MWVRGDERGQRLEKDSREHFYVEQESAHSVQLMASQMAALQRGFTTLADAVLDELDTVRAEAAEYKRERDGWALAVQQMRREQAELRALFSLTDVRASAPCPLPSGCRVHFPSMAPSVMRFTGAGSTPCSVGRSFAGSQVLVLQNS